MGLNDPLIVDIAGGQTLQAYYHLLQILGAVGEKPNRTKISLSAFKAGSTVFAFSRTPELDRADVLLPAHKVQGSHRDASAGDSALGLLQFALFN